MPESQAECRAVYTMLGGGSAYCRKRKYHPEKYHGPLGSDDIDSGPNRDGIWRED